MGEGMGCRRGGPGRRSESSGVEAGNAVAAGWGAVEIRSPVFEANLKKVKPAKGETRAEVEKYFRDKYEHLKAFLRQAIDRKESVQCSL